jgi:signal transduction histidine kinase
LVATTYVTALGLQVVRLVLGESATRLEVVDAPSAAVVAFRTQASLLSACCLAGVALIVVRRRAEGHALRRPLALLIYSFSLSLVMIAFLLMTAVFGHFGFQNIRHATLFAMGLAPAAFLFGLLDARLTRSAVADLVLELRHRPAPGELRDALARALRDPSLELLYWLPEFESWADLDGLRVEVPQDSRRAMTQIEQHGRPIAALLHDPSLCDEPELLDAVGAVAGFALENGQLQAELGASIEELQTTRDRILEAGSSERKRLERNLHDGAQQRLVALSVQLTLLERRVGFDPDIAARVDYARREIGLSLSELRDVARGLDPPALARQGLRGALESMATRAPVPVELVIDLRERLPEPVEAATYYVVSEGLANIGKHAHASGARVSVARSPAGLLVEIVDDGVGGADTTAGSGLRGLADRVESLGGRFEVWSPEAGGTGIRAELPCR